MSDKYAVSGPTYEEMLHPVKRYGYSSRKTSDRTLFDITWKGDGGIPRYMVVPHKITGVDANIIMLLGGTFPTGSHKVGSTYSVTMEKQLAGDIDPSRDTLVYPSTGNFGIGGVWVAGRMGYKSVVILPSSVSRERFELIAGYGGEYIKTRDLAGMFEEMERTKSRPGMTIMDQFTSMANYRFHYAVTGGSVIELVEHLGHQGIGNGRCSAFISAVGSGGTIAAGDKIKQAFGDSRTVALEPLQSPVMSRDEVGEHGIQGIGDGIIPWIHNVMNTDAVVDIDDADCLSGLKFFSSKAGKYHLARSMEIPSWNIENMSKNFGISGICNLLGAIKTAKHYQLPAGTNIVTVCTDSADRYVSVIREMTNKNGPFTPHDAEKIFEEVFGQVDTDNIQEGTAENRKKWLDTKYSYWVNRCGMDASELERQKDPTWWKAEQAKCSEVDEQISVLRIEKTA